jgi:hypothetical protein
MRRAHMITEVCIFLVCARPPRLGREGTLQFRSSSRKTKGSAELSGDGPGTLIRERPLS